MAKKNLLLTDIIEGILEKKGREIVDIDLTKINAAICDHFVICHGDSDTQVTAIADSIEKRVHDNLKQRVGHREGLDNAMWVLLDLWGDARILKIEESYH